MPAQPPIFNSLPFSSTPLSSCFQLAKPQPYAVHPRHLFGAQQQQHQQQLYSCACTATAVERKTAKYERLLRRAGHSCL